MTRDSVLLVLDALFHQAIVWKRESIFISLYVNDVRYGSGKEAIRVTEFESHAVAKYLTDYLGQEDRRILQLSDGKVEVWKCLGFCVMTLVNQEM